MSSKCLFWKLSGVTMWFKKNHISYKHKFLVNFNSAQKRKIHKEYYYCSSIFLVFCYAYLELLNAKIDSYQGELFSCWPNFLGYKFHFTWTKTQIHWGLNKIQVYQRACNAFVQFVLPLLLQTLAISKGTGVSTCFLRFVSFLISDFPLHSFQKVGVEIIL